MARYRRALISAALVACGGPPAPAPQAAVIVVDAGPPPQTVAVVDAGAPKPPARAHRDCGLKPGEVSDDEAPTIAGVGNSERALDWLAAHGVSNADAIKWFVMHTGHGLQAEQAEISFGEARCFDFTVNGEAGIACETSTLDASMHVAALAIMVRNKKPVAVLDLGLGTLAMDFPDAHGLDLQIVFAADGKSLELRERAPDGSQLVAAPSECVAHEKMIDECTARLASGQGDTSLCPIITDAKTGAKWLSTDPPDFHGIYPATLHDCAGAKKQTAEALKEMPRDMQADLKRDIAFMNRSCLARGKYTWNGTRYVKAS